MLAATRTSSQLLSDQKAGAEDVCIGRLLSLKATQTFVDKVKNDHGGGYTIDWNTVVGNFGSAKKKVAPKKVNKWEVTDNVDKTDSKKDKSKKPLKKTQKNVSKVNASETSIQKTKTTKKAKVKSTPIKATKTIEDDVPEETVPPTMVDSFFITDDGSNYNATAVIDRKQTDEPDDQYSNRRLRRANNSFNRSDSKHSNFTKQTAKLPIVVRPTTEPDDLDPDVHPSWSAKRKQKSIPIFQGKKITFGEASSSETAKPTNNPEESSKLHPSWEAKQKQKPVIAAFRGSKITFDWMMKWPVVIENILNKIRKNQIRRNFVF